MEPRLSVKAQRQHYRYLAYCVIRDAIGFYFGIPKFLESYNFDEVFDLLYKNKVKLLQKKKNRLLTEDEELKCRVSVDKQILKRRTELIEDLIYCEAILFTDNHWLELLDVNSEFLEKYLSSLSEESKEQLAVIPRWTTRDHALSRPYINDTFQTPELW